ncbi:hypothetical protein ACFSC4_26630 [Deinococcus malanensis]|uniref:hypothetical protein n=1 Tax=Deinococcus malanensis TaxID=1706855 RepID=UPI0016664F32|nr:hypothetical protein [Deinococcus malanensis]
MSFALWRPARLTRTQQEERRLAGQPFLDDRTRTDRDLAEQFGVAEVTSVPGVRGFASEARKRCALPAPLAVRII